MPQHNLFTRFVSLVRGRIGTSLRRAEAHNPEAVYDDAILQRSQHYDHLREAVARFTYLRTRLESDLQQQRTDLQLVEQVLAKAVRANDDTRALGLIGKKRILLEDMTRSEEKLKNLTAQTDQAKNALQELAGSIQQLKNERGEMLARMVHAEVRLQFSNVLRHAAVPSPETDLALEHAREAILQLEHEAAIERTLDHTNSEEFSLVTLRHESQAAEDAQALAALKREIDNGREKGVSHG